MTDWTAESVAIEVENGDAKFIAKMLNNQFEEIDKLKDQVRELQQTDRIPRDSYDRVKATLTKKMKTAQKNEADAREWGVAMCNDIADAVCSQLPTIKKWMEEEMEDGRITHEEDVEDFCSRIRAKHPPAIQKKTEKKPDKKTQKKIRVTTEQETPRGGCPARITIVSRGPDFTAQMRRCGTKIAFAGVENPTEKQMLGGCYCKKHMKKIESEGFLRNGDVRVRGEGSMNEILGSWMKSIDIVQGPLVDKRTLMEKERLPWLFRGKDALANDPPEPVRVYEPMSEDEDAEVVEVVSSGEDEGDPNYFGEGPDLVPPYGEDEEVGFRECEGCELKLPYQAFGYEGQFGAREDNRFCERCYGYGCRDDDYLDPDFKGPMRN
jgi:hypothetical protein